MDNNVAGDNPIKTDINIDKFISGLQGNPNPNSNPFQQPQGGQNNPNGDGSQNLNPNGNQNPNGNGNGNGEPPTQTPTTGTPPPNDQNNGQGDNVVEETFDDLVKKLSNESLSDTDKADRDNLLNSFKASKIDVNGNLLNDKGEIILSNQKLKSFLEEDKLPLDDKGNLVNDKGEIIKTNAQLLAENSIVLATKSRFETEFGITFPQELAFEDTDEGLIQLAYEASKIKSVNAVRDFLDARPSVKAYYNHLLLGGSPETYNSPVVDYKSINIKQLAEDAKIKIIKDSLISQKNPNPDTIIDLIKKAGEEEINKAVSGAINYLDKEQEQRVTQQQKQIEELEKQEQEETAKYWNDVSNVVKSGKLINVGIPLNERGAFLDYLSKPITEDGRSADMVKSEKDTLEFDVLMSYLRFKDYKVSELVKNLVNQEKVNTLREKLKIHNAKFGLVSSSADTPKVNKQGADINIDKLLKG